MKFMFCFQILGQKINIKKEDFLTKKMLLFAFSFKKNGTIKIATDIDDYAAQIFGIMEKKKNF